MSRRKHHAPPPEEFHFTAPTAWHELSSKQFRILFKFMSMGNRRYRNRMKWFARINPANDHFNELLEIDEQFPERVAIVQKLCPMPDEVWHSFELPGVVNLIHMFDWVEDLHQIEIHQSFIPRIGICKGPDIGVNHINLWELGETDQIMKAFAAGQTKAAINHLTALIYRPFGLRIPKLLFAIWEKVFVLCTPSWLRLAAYINYVGLRNNLVKRRPKMHAPSDEASSGTDLGFMGLLLAMTDNDPVKAEKLKTIDAEMATGALEKIQEQAAKLKEK